MYVYFSKTQLSWAPRHKNQVEANLEPTESNDMTDKKIFPIKADRHLLFNYHVLL